MSSTRGKESPEQKNREVCPVVRAVDQIGSQWRLIVLYNLEDGELRFNELKRESGASSRTLSRVLDDLRQDGFVERRVEEDSPIATYYSLTEKGRALQPVFESLRGWGEEWLDVN